MTIDALANDNDPEGGPVSLSGMSLPGHGSLTLTPDHRFVYTPDAGFVGTDSFSYTIRDEQGAAGDRRGDRGGRAAQLAAGRHRGQRDLRAASRSRSTCSPTTTTPTAMRCGSPR